VARRIGGAESGVPASRALPALRGVRAWRGAPVLRGVLVLLVVGALLVTAILWTMQRKLVYFPLQGPLPSAAAALDGARDVTLRTADGLELGAWHVPAGASGMTVLVANGNGGNRWGRAPLAAALAARGLGVLLFDYRGYGGNPGRPSEEGLARDVRAARAFLVGEAGVAPERLLYFGESLGTAVVTGLAAEHPPAGLLLRSPFVDLASVGKVHYPFLPVRSLLRDRHPVAELIAHIDVPTTIVYGTADRLVPPAQSLEVARVAAGPTRVVRVDGAGHNDRPLLDGAQLVDAVVDLAEQVRPKG